MAMTSATHVSATLADVLDDIARRSGRDSRPLGLPLGLTVHPLPDVIRAEPHRTAKPHRCREFSGSVPALHCANSDLAEGGDVGEGPQRIDVAYRVHGDYRERFGCREMPKQFRLVPSGSMLMPNGTDVNSYRGNMGRSWAKMDLGERLRYLRDNVLRMSAYELVSALQGLGVPVESHTTVYRYEKGRMPPANYVAAMAELAGVSIDSIMGGESAETPAVGPYASDTALVRRLYEVVIDQGWSQLDVAERTGIPQPTLSRWFRAIEEGRPIPLRSRSRSAIRSFLDHAGQDASERVIVLARQFAADILQELSEAMRASAAQAPTDDLLPPAVRRLFGESEEPTESDEDEPKSAHWDLMERAARELSERRKRDRQKMQKPGA